MGNRFNIRIEGTRIKRTMRPVSLKLYDKFGLILRIDTTDNGVSFFKHYREVEHRDGSKEMKYVNVISGVDLTLWVLLGNWRREPAYQLLGRTGSRRCGILRYRFTA